MAPQNKSSGSRETAGIACSFPGAPIYQSPVCYSRDGRLSLVDQQKFRNNWSRAVLRDQFSVCRRYASANWFLSAVLPVRHAVHVSGFRLEGGSEYDVASLVDDIAWEDMTTSNVVCLWRRSQTLPIVTVLDAERCGYRSVGGIERIQLQCSKDPVMAADQQNKSKYIESLGEKMYEAMLHGNSYTILKGIDTDWNFEVMTIGKRRGTFANPELIPVIDTLDYLELMGVGDWNHAWFRKDVIRWIKKGYAVTQGQGAGLNSVDITPTQVKEIGEGFAKVNGPQTSPMNHDVHLGYLTMGPENFDPKMVEAAIDRLMVFGSIEAVALFTSFSQQNGAAPSLMRNARASAIQRRARIERLLRRIFSHPEFEGVMEKSTRFHWSVKSLYSVDELMAMVRGTSDGIASPQTRRAMLDLDNERECELMREAHANRDDYTPPFEPKQGLLPAIFPQELGAPDGSPGAGDAGDPGRPADSAAV